MYLKDKFFSSQVFSDSNQVCQQLERHSGTLKQSVTVVHLTWSLDLKHQRHLGMCEKCKFLSLTPDLLNQKPWWWAQETVLTNSLGEPDVS